MSKQALRADFPIERVYLNPEYLSIFSPLDSLTNTAVIVNIAFCYPPLLFLSSHNHNIVPGTIRISAPG